MDEEIERIESEETEKNEEKVQERPEPKPKKPRKKLLAGILTGLLVLVLMGSSAGAAYWWRDNTAKEAEKEQKSEINSLKQAKKNLEQELAAEKAKNSGSDIVGCEAVAPSAAATEDIKASITSGNTAALAGRMASTVNVILAATEAYGPQATSQAVGSVTSFIGTDSNSWDYDFALPAATIDSYQEGDYAQYFTDTSIVGKASDGKVISFSFDCDAKISTVFMSSSDDIL